MFLEYVLLIVVRVDRNCYTGDEIFYSDNPDQQEFYKQGKYNMG
jgi:hypothetical protein